MRQRGALLLISNQAPAPRAVQLARRSTLWESVSVAYVCVCVFVKCGRMSSVGGCNKTWLFKLHLWVGSLPRALPDGHLSFARAAPQVMDVLIQAQERVISVERVVDRAIETPIAVPKEQIVEKVREAPKRSTVEATE